MNCACFLAYEFFSIWVYWASHIYTHTHTLTYTYIPHPFSLLKGLYFVHVFVKTFSSPCGFCLWRTPGKKGMLYGTPQGTASQRSETSQRHKIFASLHLLYSENFGWNSRTSLLIWSSFSLQQAKCLRSIVTVPLLRSGQADTLASHVRGTNRPLSLSRTDDVLLSGVRQVKGKTSGTLGCILTLPEIPVRMSSVLQSAPSAGGLR